MVQDVVQRAVQDVGQVIPFPMGTNVTTMQAYGQQAKPIALGNSFLDSGELAAFSQPLNARLQALESYSGQAQQKAAYEAYGAQGYPGYPGYGYNTGSSDMMPLLLVLLLSGGLGTGTTTGTDTTTLLLILMLSGGFGGQGQNNNNTDMLMLVLLLSGGLTL
jgi:hypothetical protein